ncbi:TIGR03936 family radical SAM-associated protein [Caldicellulosiruptoraceae bacterium PP1]
MPRYRFYFTREREQSFISHLDMMRLMERTFRIADIKLKFSEGFNPHPKITFILPMSVGLSTKGDIFEIELDQEITDEKIDTINNILPKGIRILKIENAINKIEVNGFISRVVTNSEPFNKNLFLKFLEGDIIIIKKDKPKNAKEFINTADVIFDKYTEFLFDIRVIKQSFIKPEEIVKKFIEDFNINSSILYVIREKINFQRGI